jgi:hypothetical protein
MAAMRAFQETESRMAQLLGAARLVGLATALVFDAATTSVYGSSRTKDFYIHLRGSV